GGLYGELKKKYGKPKGQWSLWCKRPKTEKEKEQVIIESILTQRANWKNVQLATENLKKAGICSLKDILATETERLALLIRPSGFYRQKTERLKNLCRFILETCGGIKKIRKIPTDKLRAELLSLNGIGPETADDILLYAFQRPVFVIDEYTRRKAKELSLRKAFSYQALQDLFEKSIRKNYRLYQDLHALIVIDGKDG
ncbi:MAG: endonuclease, partial [bacterium (Candidatus Ratteibacteria) CG23_combo_of_CG06-09_8_20_14_all_48_7]